MLKISLYMLLAFPIMATTVYGGDAGNEKELKEAFDAYNKSAKAGDVDNMLALRTSEAAEEIRSQIKNKQDRDYFVLIGRGQAPDSYEVQHVEWAKDGTGAELYALLHLPPMKEIQRPKKTVIEVVVSFRKENGKWKMGHLTPLGDPGRIRRPKDLVYSEKDADTSVTASVAGRIVKFEFKPDHTLAMVRVMDEEIAVFLPPKATLEKAGVNFDELAPWKMREFTGFPHKTDKLKFFATGDKPME